MENPLPGFSIHGCFFGDVKVTVQSQPRKHCLALNGYRMSMYSPASALFMLRTAQNLPHMLQVSL